MPDNTDSLRNSIDFARLIDERCDHFEKIWQQGMRPRIEDFLSDVSLQQRRRLVEELLLIDVFYRKRQGEAPSADDYANHLKDLPRLPLTHIIARGQEPSIQRSSTSVNQPTLADDAANCDNDAPCDFGDYELLEKIAHGGMGVVFKGRDADLRRDVAVKVLQKRHQTEIDLIERFVEEAQIAGQLQHPGITPVYQLGEATDGRPFFTMKLVRGDTLAQLLAARRSPEDGRERFLKVFEQICQTVAYAHSRGVIHRDLKPSNVMVGTFGEVQVMDWGLAKVLKDGDSSRSLTQCDTVIQTTRSGSRDSLKEPGSHTQNGSVLGTLAYMPQEQALGDIDLLDRRADVFGLAAILCEILTGQPPYVAPTVEELRRKAARADLADAFERLDRCGADQDLIRLARRALAPAPADRPDNAGVLADEMIKYREGVEARVREAELAKSRAIEQAQSERSRRKLMLAFFGALLTALTVGVMGTSWGFYVARKANIAANAAKDRLRRELYVADLQLADQMGISDTGTTANIAALLARQIPAKAETDLREFAWRLQWSAIHRNSVVLKGHQKGSKLVRFLPDGQVLTVDGDLSLRFWKLPNGLLQKELKLAKTLPVTALTVPVDGQQIAIGDGDQVRLFDTHTGEQLHTFRGEALSLAVSFSADGRRLGGAWGNGRVQVWESTTGKETASMSVQHADRMAILENLKLAPDGQNVFLLDYPKSCEITWLTGDRSESLCSTGHRSWVYSMALTSDGKTKATGDSNGFVCVWESSTATSAPSFIRAHRGPIWALAFSADGRRLATGGADGKVTVWDVASREQLCTFKGHQAGINDVCFATDGNTVASASEDGDTRVWDLRHQQASQVLGIHQHPVFSMAYSPDGSRMAVGIGDGSTAEGGIVKIWEVSTGKLVKEFPAAKGRLLALAYSPDGTKLLTGGYDSRLCVRDAETGLVDHVISGVNSDPSSEGLRSAIGVLQVSPDGKLVAAGFGHPTFHQSDDEQVAKVWNLATGEEVATLRGHLNTICDLAFSQDGKLLATASDDHQVKVWSPADWQVVRTFQGVERFKSVTFTADGKQVLAGGQSGTVTMWNMASGQVVHQIKGHADAVMRMALSADGRTLATASWDNTIKLWDPISGRETRTLRDHDDWISCLAFSPDGETLATGSFDATVRLWKAASLAEIDSAIAKDQALTAQAEVLRLQERERRLRRPKAKLTSEQLSRYEGTYGTDLIVKSKDDHLLVFSLPDTHGTPATFYATNVTDFFCNDREIDLRFLIRRDGTPASVIIYRDSDAVEAKRLSDRPR